MPSRTSLTFSHSKENPSHESQLSARHSEDIGWGFRHPTHLWIIPPTSGLSSADENMEKATGTKLTNIQLDTDKISSSCCLSSEANDGSPNSQHTYSSPPKYGMRCTVDLSRLVLITGSGISKARQAGFIAVSHSSPNIRLDLHHSHCQ